MAVGTEDLDNIDSQRTNQEENSNSQGNNSTWVLINEIMSIRQEAAVIRNKHARGQLRIQEESFKT